MDETLIDARGLKCPLPILKAKKALNAMAPGALLRVLSTDPGAVSDFPAFCRTTGDALLETKQEGEAYAFLIRRGG